VDKWTILFDLDDTLVMTHEIEKLREQACKNGEWKEVYASFNETYLKVQTKQIIRLIKTSQHGYRIGVVTSSPRSYAEKLLAYHRLDITVLSAFHDTKKKKPFPDPIIYAMSILDSVPNRTIYVGDKLDDVQASLSSGCIPFFFDKSGYQNARHSSLDSSSPSDRLIERRGAKRFSSWEGFYGHLDETVSQIKESHKKIKTEKNDKKPNSTFFSEYGLQNLKKRKDLEEEGYDVFFHDIYYPPNDRDGISERDKYISELIYSRKTYDNLKKNYQKPAKQLLPEIESWLNPAISLLIIPTPSRNTEKSETGESMITDLLCDRNLNFLSGTNYLKRVEEVPRYSYYKTHLKTIRFNAPKTAYNVVILDNVVSTGGTMKACIDRVKEAGAKSVIGLAVAKTRGRDGN